MNVDRLLQRLKHNILMVSGSLMVMAHIQESVQYRAVQQKKLRIVKAEKQHVLKKLYVHIVIQNMVR